MSCNALELGCVLFSEPTPNPVAVVLRPTADQSGALSARGGELHDYVDFALPYLRDYLRQHAAADI
jgi:hypothetical protein